MAAGRLDVRGSVVVVRGHDTEKRLALAETLRGIAPMLIADDPALAARMVSATAMLTAWNW